MSRIQHRLPTDGIERYISIDKDDEVRVIVPADNSAIHVIRDGERWSFCVDDEVAQLEEIDSSDRSAITLQEIPEWLMNLLLDIGLSVKEA